MPATLAPMFNDLRLARHEPGDLPGTELSCVTYKSGDTGCTTSAWVPLLLVRLAWDAGCNMEDLADGFGPDFGTDGDWSAIRDSTFPAQRRMVERALNFIAERLDVPRALHGYDDAGKLVSTRIVRPSEVNAPARRVRR